MSSSDNNAFEKGSNSESNGINSPTKFTPKEKPDFHKKEEYQISQNSTMLAIPANLSEDLQQLDEKVQSMLAKTDKMVNGQRAFACKVCGKEGKSQNIKRHIEAKHIGEVISHPCNLCEKICRSRNSLWKHQHEKREIVF